MLNFNIWLEQREDKEQDIKDAIKPLLGDIALGKPEQEWIDTNTADLSNAIQKNLINLDQNPAVRQLVDPNVWHEIKKQINSGIQIRELINKILGVTANTSSLVPVEKSMDMEI